MFTVNRHRQPCQTCPWPIGTGIAQAGCDDGITLKYAAESKVGEMVQWAIAEYKLLENILIRGFQKSGGHFGGDLRFKLEFR